MERYAQAELLVALWRLGSNADRMPTSHGILDRALDKLSHGLPGGLSDLSFSTTGVGLRCLELPDILLAAQEALLTSEPNPTYQSTLIRLDLEDATEIAINSGLELDEARAIGRAIVEASETFISERADEVEAA